MTVDLHYRIEGSGPRLCLLHPVGLDLTFFDTLAAELTPHFQVLRVDLRGHGNSSLPAEDTAPTLAAFAADVHAMFIKLHFAPAAVAGFSFGGMVAQELTLHFPQDVKALIASACGCTFTKETRTALQERGVAAEREGMTSVVETTLERWFTPRWRALGLDAPARKRLLANDVRSWKQTWNAISGLDTEARLASVRVPTLCLAATKDLSTPPAVVKHMADCIPSSRFQQVEDQPHMLFLEAAQQVASVIRSFLDETLA